MKPPSLRDSSDHHAPNTSGQGSEAQGSSAQGSSAQGSSEQSSEALRQAFLETTYGTQQARLQLASVRPHAAALPQWAAGPWGIITAWNPHGQAADPQDNKRRQTGLEQWLLDRGYPFFCGHNGSGAWQEPTFIVPGLQARALVQLGRDFGQAAVLGGVGARAALFYLPPAFGVPGATTPCAVDRRWLVPVPLVPASGERA